MTIGYRDKNLYYIPAMPDATEYTIASIDASGGKDGFEGGDAFRPTINSYMYGNAMAISHCRNERRYCYQQSNLKKASLKHNVQANLWNDSLQHFTDRLKSTINMYYWDFIRGRELAGMIPWYYNLLPIKKNIRGLETCVDTTQLLGKFGLRTNEPSYQYYFKQFVFNFG